MKHLKKLSCPLFVAGLLLFPPNGNSCGPFFDEAVFTYQQRPGAPLKWFAEGNLGVLLPGFTRSYLVIAYRYLAGRPLSKSERDGAMSYWGWSYSDPSREDGSKAEGPFQEWLAARKRVVGANTTAKDIPTYQRDLVGYGGYENCLADSFHTAALTLTDRARRFGGDRAAVVEWVKGQDMVFSDCANDKAIPPALPETSPAWLKGDRHYQVAAAYFYSRSFDQAAQGFDEIARDSGSPWHGIAPYLAARSMIRKGTVPDTVDEDALRNAETRLTKIMNDPALSNLHNAAREMLAYLGLRIRPHERNVELGKSLAGPQPVHDLKQDLIDYNWSLDHLSGYPPQSGTPDYDQKRQEWMQETQRRLTYISAGSELTDWLMTFQGGSRDHAMERWRTLHSLPWLVSALAKIDANDKDVADLLAAAAQVPAASPANPTVLYHRVRLLMQAGENDEARSLLEGFLNARPVHMNSSSRNLFLAQRMRLAASFHDFLVHAPRPRADDDVESGRSVCDDENCNNLVAGAAGGVSTGATAPVKPQLRFDRDAALILNLRLPLDLMVRSVTGDELPEPLRGEMAVATWTRAAMLDRHDLAVKLVPEMEKAYPVMKDLLEGYIAAKQEEKKQAALSVILHFPGMRPYVNSGVARTTKIEKIDNYRDNWWCADVGAAVDQINYVKGATRWSKERKYGVPNDAPTAPAFLSVEQLKSAEAEWKTLAASGAGSTYLTRATLAWAQQSPSDPRLAEALYYAVRSTRYSCEDDKASALSHKAFTLLHERYPNSKWAKQTPYWF